MSSEMLQNLIFMNFSTNFLPFVHEDHLRSQPVLGVRLPSGILATFPARTIEKLVFFGVRWFFFGFFLFSVNLFEFLVLVFAFFATCFLFFLCIFLLFFFLFVCCIRTRTTSLPDSIRII